MAELTCRDVADFFLAQVDEEAGDNITNLKLQKLVYYAQGFHLAMHGGPLFPEEIVAWAHGPVVPELYRGYKAFGAGAIPRPAGVDFDKYTPRVRELLDEVYAVYGQFSAWKLRDLTHEEPPWKDTPTNGTIPKESLRDYFRTRLVNHG